MKLLKEGGTLKPAKYFPSRIDVDDVPEENLPAGDEDVGNDPAPALLADADDEFASADPAPGLAAEDDEFEAADPAGEHPDVMAEEQRAPHA